MALIVTSTSVATLEGAYGILRSPPTTFKPVGTGIACLVEQFPWGPGQTVYQPSDTADMLLTFAPPGMDRTGSGYLAMTQKAFPQLWPLRVTGSTSPTKARVALTASATAIVTLTLNSYGPAGNSVTAVVSAATDGNTSHFNLDVTVTGPSGTTTDHLGNFNAAAAGGALSVLPATGLRLLGSVAFNSDGRPDNGTYTFATGADGTPGAADYDGTIGTGDKGLAKTEGQQAINHIFFGDPGSVRSTVNAAMLAHVESLKSRMGYINGPSAQSASAAQTDVASYRSIFLQYVDVWAYVNRDQDGAKVLVPPASFAASVASQLPPSAHISWRDPKVQGMLAGIVDLEADRGQSAYNNKVAGIVTLQRKKNGGFCFEGDVNTYNATDASVGGAYRTRMAIYILESMLDGVQSKIDGPNVEATQQPIINAAEKFLGDLVGNSKSDPENLPYLKDAAVNDLSAFNSQSALNNGDFTVPCSAQTDAGMQRIFFNLNIGDSVTITPNGPTF